MQSGNMLKNHFLNYFILALAVGFFLFLSQAGWNQASKFNQSQVVAKNALVLEQGLRFFKSDYDRFPKASEFEDNSTMAIYFSAFPPREFSSKDCPSSYEYKRPNLASFELSFCLTAKTDRFKEGWNKIIN